MSIRVHKALGYGTDALVVEQKKGYNELADPRFEKEGFHGERGRVKVTPEVLEANKKAVLLALTEEAGGDARKGVLFYESVCGDFVKKQDVRMVYEFEYSDIPAVVLIPPECDDWYRHDDIIDYYECGCGIKTSFRYLEGVGGIFPWTGQMIRFRGEGDELPMEVGEYNREVGRWDEKIKPIAKGDRLKDLLENWRPTLPWSILAWIQCQPWITDKKAFTDMLRPCIYTYWC